MNPPEPELFAALRPVIDAFRELGVEYFIGGSVASGVLGEPRQTLDADVVAALLGRHAAPLVERLEKTYYADLPAIIEAIERQGSFNLIHLDSMVKIDVYVSWRSEFARSQFERRIRANLSDAASPLEVYLASSEDTVLAKLDWYRQGGGVSDRQWRDVLGVLKVQAGNLDLDYLRQWAARLSLTDLLQRAFVDAGIE